ncbi:MAG: polysaccharide deacetylase family protein [Chitinophagaceae bacterium]|nr:polysaccharide deacetylase family protein [Chitinophagaceae bacterium]
MKRFSLNAVAVALFGFIMLLAAGCGSNKNKTVNADKKDSLLAQNTPGTPIKYDSSKRYIFLTWDDSPWPPGTENCMNVFKQQGVKATFFSVGANAFDPKRQRMIDTLRNAYPQFLLANHSWSHANNKYHAFYANANNAVADFLKMQDEYKVPVKIIRLPGMNSWASHGKISGQKTPYNVCKILDSLGFSIIGWDVEWTQGKGSTPVQSATQMAQMVQNMLDNGETHEQNAIVILSHDRLFGKPQYADSLTKFISTLKQDNRNVFETIDHYPAVQRK